MRPVPIDKLPDLALDEARPLARLLAGAGTLHDAARWIEDLPYGRNSSPLDYHLVPLEQRGTCTTKHAFLAALGREQGCSLQLLLCFFEMSGETHRAIAETLAQAGLDSILEAHCVIGFAGKTFDATGLTSGDRRPKYSGFTELSLERLDQKKVIHRAALAAWAARRRIAVPLEDLWPIREQCIRDLAHAGKQENQQ